MNEDKRKNKPVYFSKIKKRDLVLLEYAEQIDPLTGKPQNFSEFVKDLIEERMLREKQGGNNNNNNYTRDLTIISSKNDDNETYKLEVTDEEKEAMNSFL